MTANGFSTGEVRLTSDDPGVSAPLPTFTEGRMFGLDPSRGADQCVLTIWEDGRIIDSGPYEDFVFGDDGTLIRKQR